MQDYKNILLNFCIGAAIWAAVVALASALDTLLHEEPSIILAAVVLLPPALVMQSRLAPGRKHIPIAIAGLAASSGLAGFSSAPYISDSLQLFFLPAFLLVFGFLGYLAFALFAAGPAKPKVGE